MKATRSRSSAISGVRYSLNEVVRRPKLRKEKLRLCAQTTKMRVEVASFGRKEVSNEERRRHNKCEERKRRQYPYGICKQLV
jgi:hypothetical protein